MGICRNHTVPETREDEIQFVLLRDSDLLGAPAPRVFLVDDGDRACKENTGQDVAGDDDHDGQPLAALVGRDTLDQERLFLGFHGGEDAANRIHQVFASARRNKRLGRRSAVVMTNGSLVDQNPQLRLNDRLQRCQPRLLARIVLGQCLNVSQGIG
jgi:hypothetical protein